MRELAAAPSVSTIHKGSKEGTTRHNKKNKKKKKEDVRARDPGF
jgi:hypothetical protein